MDEAIDRFIQFIYFLIDTIRDLVLSVSGKADKKPAADANTDEGPNA